MDYLLLQSAPVIDMNEFLFGKEDPQFLIEVVVRSAIMFCMTVAALRVMGKRGVAQLSVFELIVILNLGSAAGDAMFYKEVGLLPVALVFAMVTLLYRVVVYGMGKNQKFEDLMEGKPRYLIRDGKFDIEGFSKEDLANDEFFLELRLKGVSHLGQVDKAIIETNGQISLFFYEDKAVKFGLPILPDDFKEKLEGIAAPDIYSCSYCGNTEQLAIGPHRCKVCQNSAWVKSKNERRVT